MTIHLPVERAELVNLMEDTIEPIDVQGRVCRLTLKPFEIISVRVWPHSK